MVPRAISKVAAALLVAVASAEGKTANVTVNEVRQNPPCLARTRRWPAPLCAAASRDPAASTTSPQFKLDSPVGEIQWVGTDKKVRPSPYQPPRPWHARARRQTAHTSPPVPLRPVPPRQTIFVRSDKNYIYRSGDEGKSWERQNYKMEKERMDNDRSGILSFHASPSDSNKIFFRGVGKQHYHSVNRGES